MPVDPSISLAVPKGNPMDVAGGAKPSLPGDGQGGNPLSMVEGLAGVQNQLNQLKLFNQTYSARQKFGQIMATAPDMATGVAQASADPDISAFVPELLNTIAGTANTMQNYRGQVQSQTADAFGKITSLLPGAVVDPNSLKPGVAAMLNNIPDPGIRATVAQSANYLAESLTADLPSDPKAASAEVLKRLTAIGVGTGSLDAMSRIWGAGAQVQLGGKVQPGVVAPSFPTATGKAPGEFTPAGNPLSMTLPPQITDVPNPAGGSTKAVVGGAGGTGGTVLGRTPTTVEAGELGSSAEAAKSITEGVNQFNDTLPVRIRALDTIESAMGQFQAGGGAPTRAVAGQMLQAFKNIGVTGIDDKMIDKVANGSLSGTQLFDTQLKPLLVKMLSSDAHGSGRVMLPEVETYIHLLDSAKDPKAILAALNNIRYGYQVGYDKSQKWGPYQASGADPGQFTTDYNAHFDPAQLPAKAGELRLTPTPMSAVKGGTSGQITHRYIPGRGIVPVPAGGQ